MSVADGPPATWRPMRPYVGRARPPIRDPIVEPLWSGVRVIAHIDPPSGSGTARAVRLIEDGGADLAPELPELRAALAEALDASWAIVDGVVTRQVALEGIGAAPVPEVRSSASRMLIGHAAEIDVLPRGTAPREDAPDGFVALDLLVVDGAVLLDVPLLERKRVLESVIRESALVRHSVMARPPVDAWVATWKALGLRGGILKTANGRYRPGERTVEWRLVERVGRAGS